ncbi:ABC transporter substrate-binding protein [Nostoc sp. UHCC 0870]|uniref:ABC transporter substrate-binding protein n=1 Tax=Nostoc sp. UHCC 0870 TaxID=2914041 RepID=UPI001EE00ED6|nr:iron-siderophore ABC transporter substrate-binding protein [Nostoc sp. UHCC 0870]UKO96903.1 iron-siderophore ABC transporter substrate-binding protein [Nostoc sp. UHCC 0870]
MNTWFKYIKLLLLSVCTFLLVTGCNSNISELLSNQSTSNITTNCRVINHEAGKTQICGQPKKVVALSPPVLDMMLALGVQPAGYAEVDLLNSKVFDRPKEQIPYLGDRITSQPINVGDRGNPSLESLLQLKPDLILGEAAYNESEYQILNKIAPTILINHRDGITPAWQQTISIIAQALGREDKVPAVIAEYEQKLSQAKTAIAPIAQHQELLLLAFRGITLTSFTFGAETFAGKLLQDLGFKLISPESTEYEVALEVLPKFKSDLIVVMPSGNNNIENAKRQWSQNPILQSISATNTNRIYFIDYQLASRIRGPIAAEFFVNQVRQLLTSYP